MPWNQVANASEFSSLDVLFDEFWIKSVTVRYWPRNKYSAQSTATSSASGSPGDLNTCAATFYFLPNAATNYTDQSTAWVNASVAAQHKTVNLGENFTFTVRNPEKFSWDGILGDQTTGSSCMSWCQTTNATKYGGYFGIATPVQSGASAGIGLLLENGVFGDAIYSFDVAWRARA